MNLLSRYVSIYIVTYFMHLRVSLDANIKKFRISASVSKCPQSLSMRFVLHACFNRIQSALINSMNIDLMCWIELTNIP